MKKIFRNIAGSILILFGIIGGFIPVLQGWMFVLAGYIILDFKKKQLFEDKILIFLHKYKIGRKLVSLWFKVKKENKDVINHRDDKLKDVIKSIHKDIEVKK